MARIKEIIIEPNKIYINSLFKLKVKVEDYYAKARCLISEDGKAIITEDNKNIRTEWGG